MGPEAVAAASIGGLALEAGSSIYKGLGDKATQDYMAQRDQRNAQFGRLKADQAGAHMQEELNNTIANIDVIRSAAGTDPLSPTGLALREEERRVGDRERRTRLSSIMAQVDEDEATATYRRSAGRQALLGSFLGASARLGRGLGSLKY